MTHERAKKRSPRGFTLIELMLVVLIIGILSSLAIPRILNSAARARKTEAVGMVEKMRRHFIPIWRSTGSYPTKTSAFNPANLVAQAGQPATWDPNADGWKDFTFPPEGGLRLRYKYFAGGDNLHLHAEGNLPGLDTIWQYDEVYVGDTLVGDPVENPEL